MSTEPTYIFGLKLSDKSVEDTRCPSEQKLELVLLGQILKRT
jgi:hypothetical protein